MGGDHSNQSEAPAELVRAKVMAPGVLLLTLNRPEKRNALSTELLAQLLVELNRAAADPSIACVILTGEGRAFAAGADISDMLERGVASYADPDRQATWDAIGAFEKPMIAAINGYALGGGLELALMADIIIAAHHARFACPEIKIGSFPGDGGTQRLPRAVGKSFAMQMVLTGMMVDADLAERKGLVSEVVQPEDLLSRSVQIAVEIAGMSVAITPYAKRAVNASFEMQLVEGLAQERALTIEAFATEDRVEGLRAFAAKRSPVFKGK